MTGLFTNSASPVEWTCSRLIHIITSRLSWETLLPHPSHLKRPAPWHQEPKDTFLFLALALLHSLQFCALLSLERLKEAPVHEPAPGPALPV